MTAAVSVAPMGKKSGGTGGTLRQYFNIGDIFGGKLVHNCSYKISEEMSPAFLDGNARFTKSFTNIFPDCKTTLPNTGEDCCSK